MARSKRDWAVALASRGFRVFPLCENTKDQPLFPGWPAKATSDPQKAYAFWTDPVTEWEQLHNPAVATGEGLTVFDVDTKPGKRGAESLAQLAILYDDLPITFTVRTATGGMHYYFRTTVEIANSQSAIGPGLDVRGYHGYVVAPGATTEQGEYEIITDAAVADCPDWLLGLMQKARPREPAKVAQAVRELDTESAIARATRYLVHEAPEAVEGAAGDATTYMVAARVKDFGVSAETCLDLMLARWNERCAPQWSPDELEVKVGNAYRYGSSPIGVADAATEFPPVLEQPQGSSDLDPLPVLPFEPKAIPRRRWLLGSLTLAGKVTVIVAPPGAGKSTLTIALAVSMASGKPLLDMPVHARGGAWLYNNEDDLEEMRRRLAAVLQHGGVPFDQLSENGRPLLYMNSGERRPLLIAQRVDARQGGSVLRPRDVDAVIQHIKAKGIKTFIVDPFAETHPAAENSNEEILLVARMYRRIAQEADCSVVLVHHTRKLLGGSSEGHAGNLDSARGASSLGGVARVMATLESMSEADAKRHRVKEKDRHLYVRLDGAKANLSLARDRTLWLKRVSVSLPTWDVPADNLSDGSEGGDGGGVAALTDVKRDEGGRALAFESVGVLEPVALEKPMDAETAKVIDFVREIVPLVEAAGGRMPVADVAEQLIAEHAIYSDMKPEAMAKRIKRALIRPIEMDGVSVSMGEEQRGGHHRTGREVILSDLSATTRKPSDSLSDGVSDGPSDKPDK